jgi:hypothetical protein
MTLGRRGGPFQFRRALLDKRGGREDPALCTNIIIAGWSSPVARQAHNLKVVGSNPTPATKFGRVRPGHIVDKTYLRHGGQPRAEWVVQGLQGSLLQIDVSEIVSCRSKCLRRLLDADALANTGGSTMNAALACHFTNNAQIIPADSPGNRHRLIYVASVGGADAACH